MTGIWWDMCVHLWSIHVSHILEPRLSHVPTPDQPSAQRPGRPKDLTEKDGGVWLGSAWTDDIGWVCKDASKGSPQEPFVKYQTCVQRTPCAMRTPCVCHAVQHRNFSNGVTLLCDLKFKQFELGTEAVEQAAPGTHCLNRTELWSQFSFTKQNCVYLFLKCFFVKEWFWFFFALRW